jgi:hypothetical protein
METVVHLVLMGVILRWWWRWLERRGCACGRADGPNPFVFIEIPEGVYSTEVQYLCQCRLCGLSIRMTLADLQAGT